MVAGREDPATPVDHARELADAVPGAGLVEIPRAAHLAGVEQPRVVTSALLAHFTAGGDDGSRHAAGLAVRRKVLGDAHVDRALARTTPLTAAFQDFITRYAWGEIWSRPGLDHRTRRCLTLTALVALNHHAELEMHLRAALTSGDLSPTTSGKSSSSPPCTAGCRARTRPSPSPNASRRNRRRIPGVSMHTTVAVVGGGPAGLLLARLLRLADIDCVVLERRDRAYVEQRQRAGVLEQSTVDALREAGAAERLDAEGLVHSGVELRWDGRSHRIDFPSLTGGRRVWVYAQTEVVKDLIALHRATGTPVHFEAEVRAVEGVDTERPTVRYTHRGQERTLTCDYVVGCDGYHGVARTAVPQGVRRTYERVYPYSWLGVTAEVPPSCDELVYAHSPAASPSTACARRRSAGSTSRCPTAPTRPTGPTNGSGTSWRPVSRWTAVSSAAAPSPPRRSSPAQFRDRTHAPRKAVPGRRRRAHRPAHRRQGPQPGRLRRRRLARALVRRRHTGETDLLDAYSDTCLRRVWRAEHFSYFMTTTLHTDPGQSRFDTRLQIAQLDRIAASPHAEAELALNYAGLPLP